MKYFEFEKNDNECICIPVDSITDFGVIISQRDEYTGKPITSIFFIDARHMSYSRLFPHEKAMELYKHVKKLIEER